MEFERLRVGAFGRIRDLDTGPEALPSLVVVFGENEAGKSTVFQFLTAMLYGFYPATKDGHPLGPWDGAEAEGEAVLRLGSGEKVELYRRLRSTPSGSLVRAGRQEDLRNRTVPAAEHVPRGVFLHVFALTLSELVGLAGESWARVQDRLLSRMGATDLTSVRDTIRDLEKEAGRLWRPTRVGNQRVRELRAQIGEARSRRRDAVESDRRLREAVLEIDRLKIEMGQRREERAKLQARLERDRTLLPIRQQLRRIAELREEAGDPDELTDLPDDPALVRRRLEEQIDEAERRLAALARDAEEPAHVVASDSEDDRRLREHGDSIRAWLASAQESAALREVEQRTDRELRNVRSTMDSLVIELYGSDARIPTLAELEEIDIEWLGAAVARLSLEAPTRETAAPPRSGAIRVALAIAVVGVLLLVVGLLTGRAWIAALGAALAAIGGTRARAERRAQGHGKEAPTTTSSPSTDEIATRLDGLGLPEARLRVPDFHLVRSLERLRTLAARAEELTRASSEWHARHESVADAWAKLSSLLATAAPADPEDARHRLGVALREAERKEARTEAARWEIERIERERARVAAELDDRRAALQAHDSDDEDGGEATDLVRRARALARARQLREELERTHPDLERLVSEIEEVERSEDDWTLDREAVAMADLRLSELSGEIEELGRRLEGLQKDVAYLEGSDRVDTIDGEIRQMEEEVAEALRERDRLWVTAALIREADRRVREEHQPDVLKQAGRYLATITGGRYQRILIDEAGEGRFLLRGPGYPGPVVVDEPISTGTREQVYLALRLAIVDQLDRAGERLPLFMDETFVNWDAARRGRAFELLEEISRTRQIFLFTCHESMAGALRAKGARRIDLSRSATTPLQPSFL